MSRAGGAKKEVEVMAVVRDAAGGAGMMEPVLGWECDLLKIVPSR